MHAADYPERYHDEQGPDGANRTAISAVAQGTVDDRGGAGRLVRTDKAGAGNAGCAVRDSYFQCRPAGGGSAPNLGFLPGRVPTASGKPRRIEVEIARSRCST